MKKHLGRLCAIACALALCVPVAGCGNGADPNSSNTLDIFIGNFGYGYEWLEDQIELFKQQDWVKEKYPDLVIPAPKNNSERNYPENRILAGATANTFDLLFSCQSASTSYGRTDSSGRPYFEDLTVSVYQSTVPGEDVTVAEKMLDDVYAQQAVEKSDGGTAYYGMPWINGYMGILYNKTLVEKYLGASYVMPRTTTELSGMAAVLKTKRDDAGNTVVPFISASKEQYWNQMFVTWWAQYEGLDNYNNFWNGVNENGERTPQIFAQTGRLRALETLQSLIGYDTGNNHPEINTLEFTQAQAKFLIGEAVMMPNGDWFECEMRVTQAENPYDYEIGFMKMPVISSIVEKLTTIKDDGTLAAAVDAVDAGMPYEEAKTAVPALAGEGGAADYEKITEARRVMYRVDGHEAYIPSYAAGKEVAKDFLRFLATDISVNAFMKSTYGAGTCFEYDIREEDPAAYESFAVLQKDRITMADTGLRIPAQYSYKLSYYGGVTWFARTSNVEIAMTAQNPSDRKSAQTIWQDDITYYTENDEQNWKSVLTRAGLN